MKHTRQILLILFTLIFTGIYARDYKPSDIENPNIANRGRYVADPAGLLSGPAKSQADKILWNLRQKTSAEVVVAVVPNTGEMTEEEFATQLFDDWKIGKRDKDNGLLVLIVPEQRAARIATGYGVEGIIPDISALKIINRSIVPHMKENDLDGAVVAVAGDVANVLSSPEASEELKSSKGESWEEMPESDITGDDILMFACCVALAVFLFTLGMFIYDSRNLKRKDRYQQALAWHEKRTTYLLLGFLSLGLGLITYLLVNRKYNRSRNAPLTCPTCRSKMQKLNEEEDNALLSPQQDFEEKLNTVDYDVWVCPDCGTVERYPFRIDQKQYEECPNCHTVAMHLVRDHTVQPATTQREGTGEKIYECKYCHNRTRRRYTIPRKADGSAAALGAAAVLGSGRHGGGFGGGFGGGMTGGGGATGRW